MAIEKKQSSGEVTGDTLIHTGKCLYYGFVCVTGGANIVISIYDNTAASGKVVERFTTDSNKPTDGHSHSAPVECRTGLYVDITGVPTSVVVYYSPVREG